MGELESKVASYFAHNFVKANYIKQLGRLQNGQSKSGVLGYDQILQ